MHDNSRITENRVTRTLLERIIPTEIARRDALAVRALHLPGEPSGIDEIDLDGFEPIAVGDPWGPPWGTTWFAVSGEVPALSDPERQHLGIEVRAEIGFTGALAGFQAEAAVYVDGLIRCGLHPRRRAVPIDLVADRSGHIDFLVEAAANPDFTSSFTANPLGDPATAGSSPLYRFGGIELITFHRSVRELTRELATLNEIMRTVPRGSARRQRLTTILERALNALDFDDLPGSAPDARAVLAEGFEPAAAADAHRLSAVGHAHIDTAWLWPERETRRKCARTFANQIQLMDAYPEHVFACSQAAQYDYIANDHPELFERIRSRVAEGRWVPVGGMWVEADMNLPSGESLVRQLTAGQRYFEERFGIRCREIWLPDVFGYPANLPQVFRAGGCNRFLTQKLSWNKQNRFPHHSFTWEGIDGSEVLAHFPPVETYNSELTPTELDHASTNFSDHGWSDHSLVPFGHGDGGGGPTAEMLDRARLLNDVAGLPRLRIRSPADFFEDLEAELARPGTPRWRGELYFEMHRGTLTSQAHTKVGNRRCELALREVELWAATVGDTGHATELDRLWKRVLTQQFHDILPGSSIAWVHRDAEAEHDAVLTRLEEIRGALLDRIAPAEDLVVNPATHARREVVRSPVAPDAPDDSTTGPVQGLSDGSYAFSVQVPGMGFAPAVPRDAHDVVEATTSRLCNGSLELHMDESGSVWSIRDLRFDRELVPAGSRTAAVQIAADHPVEYDAWDLESWTAPSSVDLPPATSVTVLEEGPLVGSVEVRRDFGDSALTQTFTLTTGSPRLDITIDIDWAEDEKYLSIDFPLDVRSDTAACEVQFGHVKRPTHTSTSWDAAKFEVCAHRWVDLSESTFGVAVLNDGRYGHSVHGGGIRVSLLRAPKYPDPTADRGRHRVTVSVLAHGTGLAEVLSHAEALNTPLRVRPAAHATGGTGAEADAPSAATDEVPAPLLTVEDPRIAVSAVKLADDGSGDLIVRLWEGTGDRVRTTVGLDTPASSVQRCDLLEEPYAHDHPELSQDGVHLDLRPFQLVTLRISR